MENLCKTCNKNPRKLSMPYCSIECINKDEEFHEICRTALNLVDAAKKCGISETSFRRITEQLGIKITVKPKPPKPLPIKICPKCGREHTSKYGKHCTKKCANTRFHTEESKKKISESTKKALENPEIRKKITENRRPITEEQRKKLSESLKKYHKKRPQKTKEEKIAKNRFHRMAYYAKQKAATTEDADKKLIKKIYENLPEGYNVDHIIPITKGGLHHQDNLQYLPKAENCRKGNRLDYVPDGAIQWQDILDLTNNK